MRFILKGKANFATKVVNFILSILGIDYGFNFFCVKENENEQYFNYEFGKLNLKRTRSLYQRLIKQTDK